MIYLDLVNAEWEAVEITAAGWRVVSNPQVKSPDWQERDNTHGDASSPECDEDV